VQDLIFLGAGASKPFGIKTMEDLTQDLDKQMRDKGYSEIMDNILERLQNFGLTPDFEAIYTILEGLVDPEQGIKNAGPLAAYVSKDLKDIKPRPEFEEILFVFRKLIYEACTIRQEMLGEIRRVYNQLFKIYHKLSGPPAAKEETRVLTSAMGKMPERRHPLRRPITDTIVTTNYDMSLELYHRMVTTPLTDGFKTTADNFVKEFDPKEYARAEGSRWLIKLHGAIWQFKQGDKIIKTIDDPKQSLVRIKIDEQMMIYPVGEKPILRNPYYTFYKIFTEQTWNKMIAIGYSFRDEPVNVAILENLERIHGATLIVVNPKPQKVIKNLGELSIEIHNRIIPVKGEFGKDVVFEKLPLAISVSSRETINARWLNKLLE